MLSLHTAPPSIYKSSCPTGCQRGGAGFRTDVHLTPPHFQSLASKIKQTFLSTNLACLLAFEQQAARPHHILSISTNGVVGESHRAEKYSAWNTGEIFLASRNNQQYIRLLCEGTIPFALCESCCPKPSGEGQGPSGVSKELPWYQSPEDKEQKHTKGEILVNTWEVELSLSCS